MKTKEVIVEAARLLGFVNEVNVYLEENAGSGQKKTEDLLSCYNLVETELALDYFPLLIKETFSVKNKQVYYQQFPLPIARVISVTDVKGTPLSYQLGPTEIVLHTDVKEAIVEYAYLPEPKSILDDGDYQSRVSIGLMAYGVASAYCAMQGLYAEAAFWDKKYKEGIRQAYTIKKGGRMQSRRWV